MSPLRAFVVRRLEGGDRTDRPCKVTLEVVDSDSGRTAVFTGNANI